MRIRINDISERIVKYRSSKGKDNIDNVDRFKEYENDVIALRDIYSEIIKKRSSLDELTFKVNAIHKKDTIKNLIFGGIIGFIFSILASLILKYFCG